MTRSEFGFELQVCQWAERHWPPVDDAEGPIVVARQFGIRERRWDTIVLECDPAGLEARANFGADALDSDLLHVVRHAPAEWAWYKDALPDPGYPWRYVREAVHRAGDRGVIDKRKGSNGRIELRRKWKYPDWVDRIVAIENKPDLDASAARDLQPQIERDVALGLADEVWIATATTDDRVAPALLEDVPVEAGILTMDPNSTRQDAADVAWHPRGLDPAEPGTRIIERPDGGAYDASAARFEYADPDWKASKRREIAERAYARGWRAYVESMRADCRHFELVADETGMRPNCAGKGHHQTAAECRGSCPEFEPEPPVWRQGGWPIEGGPGAGIKRLLQKQRRRRRPGLGE
ncbi:DUF5787 family protein [Halobacteriales archaeon Cl-PHB]